MKKKMRIGATDRYESKEERYDEDFKKLEDEAPPEVDSETRSLHSKGIFERSADKRIAQRGRWKGTVYSEGIGKVCCCSAKHS